MHTPWRYEDLKHVDAARSRHRDRHLAHLRALRMDPGPGGFIARLIARVQSGASFRRPAVLTYDLRELRGAVCRTADGATGRIAVRRTDGVWMAVCERA
jgi:hypothetical protein